MSTPPPYPLRIRARLDEPLNRWLWLVKWLLAIPHYIVLALLWAAFTVLSVVAFVGILFTGRYPRAIFEFNVGVLRWTWRVAFYSFCALGTDRYPPFTLGPAPDYPATLEIDYPERLSRGLVLVKWWLLAIPHYLVVGILTSGSVIGIYTLNWGGLIGLLVLVAAVTLLFTGRYPTGLFDLVIGLNRWTLRVTAYATLMTDRYPPFRLDSGPAEPSARSDEAGAATVAPSPYGWTVGPVIAVVAGAVLALGGLSAAAGGVGAFMLTQARGIEGFLSTDTERLTTSGYALVTEEIEVAGRGVGLLRDTLGTVRVEVGGSATPLFVGIARRADAEAYLRGIAHDEVTHLAFFPGVDDISLLRHAGTAPTSAPGALPIWAAKATGTGVQTLTWDVRPGDWQIVVMNADATAPVSTDLRLGARLPMLEGLATGLYIAAAVLVLAGAALMAVGIRATTREHGRAKASSDRDLRP
ncbi:DUF4389 domain-containing protein [Spongiactinospora sp. TRM90649]|uniref:DUF4389 domain-containing protein n=1 Tax=Spongiactinospora sp. TRM90649 TaxID=3031114 RepID=UPI003211CA02